jgi:hypothetical protein
VVERGLRGLPHRGVGGQPEVVVRAERDALAALHLHDRAGLAVDLAEVGQQVVLAGRVELLEALVSSSLLEEVFH